MHGSPKLHKGLIPFNQICIVEWDGAGIGKHITLRPTVHRVLGRLNSRHRKTILPCPIASDQCNLNMDRQ